MTRVRVCHLVTSFLLGDGPSLGIVAQIASQDRARFTSTVWSLYPPPTARDPALLAAQNGFEFRTFNMGNFLDVTVVPELVRALRAGRFDILHCHLLRANLYGRFAGRLARVPVIISTLRNIESYMESRDPMSRVVRLVERMTVPLVTAYVAVSEAVRNVSIDRLGIKPDKIETILNAVEIRDVAPLSPRVRERLSFPKDALVVGSVGRLHAQKNFGLLVEAAAALVSTVDNAYFVIVGEGEERRSLETKIAGYGLSERFRLAGFTPDVDSYLAAMDVFVSTSVYEGLPRALMEAMAAGKPVVVTDVGGNGELVEDSISGFVIEVSGAALVEKLTILLRDPDLRQNLGRAARNRVMSRFGAKRMADEHEELYLRLLGKAKGGA